MKFNEHHNDKLIRADEKSGIRVYELTPDDGPIRAHRFYVVRCDGYRMKSAVPNDFPQSGTWFANGISSGSISYVAGGRTRSNAMYWFRRIVREYNEKYGFIDNDGTTI